MDGVNMCKPSIWNENMVGLWVYIMSVFLPFSYHIMVVYVVFSWGKPHSTIGLFDGSKRLKTPLSPSATSVSARRLVLEPSAASGGGQWGEHLHIASGYD